MSIVYRDSFYVNNSKVYLDLHDSIDFEDIVIFRAEAKQHEKITGRSTRLPSTYRTLKDWIIKGE